MVIPPFSATKASRGAPLMPLPTLSASRAKMTRSTEAASAKSGFVAAPNPPVLRESGRPGDKGLE